MDGGFAHSAPNKSYEGQKNAYAGATDAGDIKGSVALLNTTEENARRLAHVAERLSGITDRACGSRPREASMNDAKVAPSMPGLSMRLGMLNTRTSLSLDEIERALNTLESFV